MIIAFHVSAAFLSLVLAGFVSFWPSRAKLISLVSAVTATLASGTYLVINTKTNLLGVCITGITYLGLVTVGFTVGYLRLTARKINY